MVAEQAVHEAAELSAIDFGVHGAGADRLEFDLLFIGNEPELAELPEELRRDMKFVPVATLEQALKVSLPQEAPAS